LVPPSQIRIHPLGRGLTSPLKSFPHLLTAHARSSSRITSGGVSMAGKKRPVWRVGRDHLCGYAMDFGGITPALDSGFGCPAATLVALRQPRLSLRGHRCALLIFEVQTGVKENLVLCRRPRRAGLVGLSPGASDSLRNQLASPFPARRSSVPQTTTPGARGCVVSASDWAHSPRSSFAGWPPLAPRKWPLRAQPDGVH